jgi:hypothetical protein
VAELTDLIPEVIDEAGRQPAGGAFPGGGRRQEEGGAVGMKLGVLAPFPVDVVLDGPRPLFTDLAPSLLRPLLGDEQDAALEVDPGEVDGGEFRPESGGKLRRENLVR